ncbi:hypothetical protein IAU59_000297 [Kwoniella sp. CBS 9459]
MAGSKAPGRALATVKASSASSTPQSSKRKGTTNGRQPSTSMLDDVDPYTPVATPKKPKKHVKPEDVFPFDDIDLFSIPSSSSSRLPVTSIDDSITPTPRKRSKRSLGQDGTPSISTREAVTDRDHRSSPGKKQISPTSPREKRMPKRARPETSGSDSDLTDLDDLTEDTKKTPKGKGRAKPTVTKARRIPNHSSTLPSPSLSPLSPPSALRSPAGSRRSQIDSDDDELPGMREILALCDAESEIEGQVTTEPSTREEKPFKPTPLPDGVDVGDSVFVKNGYNWYFGKLIGYKPADNPLDQKRGKDIWTVRSWPDGLELSKRPEGNVLTIHDERIATCTLDEWETEPLIFISDALVRSPTPVPPPSLVPNPATSASVSLQESFCNLSRSQQMIAIRPRLQSIISDDYPPAKWRADLFFGSAKDRASLNSRVGYGDIPETEVMEVIIPELQRWARRAEVVHGKGREGQPPRPIGSDRYNAIDPTRLNEYLENVLLPEAIIELCIRSYDLAADDEEDDKHRGTRDRTGDPAEDEYDVFALSETKAEGEEELVKERSLTGITNLDSQTAQMVETMEATIKSVKAAIAAENPFAPHDPDRDPNNTTTSTGDAPLDPAFKLYEKARLKLSKLHAQNDYKQWESCAAELRFARRKMRKKLGLPDETMNKDEREAWNEAWKDQNEGRVQRWSGRKAKVIDYAE